MFPPLVTKSWPGFIGYGDRLDERAFQLAIIGGMVKPFPLRCSGVLNGSESARHRGRTAELVGNALSRSEEGASVAQSPTPAL